MYQHVLPAIRWLRAASHRVLRVTRRLAGGSALASPLGHTAPESGMSTAEYAVGTIAACAFAALLYKVVTSTQVFDLLTGLVTRALHTPF